MSGWLFDTSILSALSPGRPTLAPKTVRWLEERNDDSFLSSILVAETERGIAKLRRLGSVRRASELTAWFDHLLQIYGDRLLSFDLAAAHIAAQLSDAAEAIGRHPGFADVAMAAIAKSNDLVVLTANRRHFEPLGVDVLNPLEII
jgi:toxin FitB